MDSYGYRIKRIREAAKLTQEELGAKIGTTGVTIMRYEKGLREPKIARLNQLSDAMAISVNFFLSAPPFESLEFLNLFKNEILGELDNVIDGVILRGKKSYSEINDFEFWSVVSSLVSNVVASDNSTLRIYLKETIEGNIEKLKSINSNKLAQKLLRDFEKLNPDGQNKAIERIEELLEIKRYQK